MLKLWTIIIINLAFTSFAYAQDEVPKMTSVAKDEPAPFGGTIFNAAAMATLIAQTENARQECKLREAFIEDREKSKCDLAVGNAAAALAGIQQRHDSIMTIKNEEINRLNKIALSKPNAYNHWWFAGGTVVGIVTSVVIFYAAVETAK